MLLDAIQAQLSRLQLHPVNLGVFARDDHSIGLRGSLLQYWKMPAIIDSRWFLGILESLPDSAGPEAIMNAVSATRSSEAKAPDAS